MNANQVTVHEVDGRRMHTVPDGLDEDAGGPGANHAGRRPPGNPLIRLHLPFRSDAYDRAVALLSLYRSRLDFLEQMEIEPIGIGPALVRRDPSAVH